MSRICSQCVHQLCPWTKSISNDIFNICFQKHLCVACSSSSFFSFEIWLIIKSNQNGTVWRHSVQGIYLIWERDLIPSFHTKCTPCAHLVCIFYLSLRTHTISSNRNWVGILGNSIYIAYINSWSKGDRNVISSNKIWLICKIIR